MPQAANCSQRIPFGHANRPSVGGDVPDAPLQEIADILSAFRMFVTFHNSLLQMMPKIVKVFTLESLDLFLTLCYNMIDVKIGLAAGSLGQFGD